MKTTQYTWPFFFLVVVALLLTCCNAPKSELEELIKIGKQLEQNEQIAYSYQISIYRSYANDTSYRQGIIYFEHNPRDTSIGFNFSQESDNSASFYNGEYVIHMEQKDSFAYKKPLCDYRDGHMTAYPSLELSYVAIQNFLTDSLFTERTDSIVKMDTIINNELYYSYSFWADSKIVDTYKLPNHKGRKKINLIVRKSDHLPILYSQYEPIHQNKDYHYYEAQFNNYSFKKRHPNHQFSIENVPEYYSWDKYKVYFHTLEINSKAPDWDLPLVFGSRVSLSDLKGKFILLDFWFIGCGACVESIPALNMLQAKYRSNNFEVIGVNCYSNDLEKIKAYCAERNMQYRNVWKGDSICNDYMIRTAPIFYIIDRDGKIVYSQIGNDEDELGRNVEEIINYAP